MRSARRRLQNWLQRARLNDSNALLQHHKNLMIEQTKASEKPYRALHQNLQRGVVLWVLEVVVMRIAATAAQAQKDYARPPKQRPKEIQIVRIVRRYLITTPPQNPVMAAFLCGSTASLLQLLRCDGVARYLNWLVSRTGTVGQKFVLQSGTSFTFWRFAGHAIA
jgi:hypothetical protein